MALKGSKHKHAKLNEGDVVNIRGLLARREELRAELENLTMIKIAEKFEVHPQTIKCIDLGRTWTHV